MTAADTSLFSHFGPQDTSNRTILAHKKQIFDALNTQLSVKLPSDNQAYSGDVFLKGDLSYDEKRHQFTLKLYDPLDLIQTFFSPPSGLREMGYGAFQNDPKNPLIPCYVYKANKLKDLVSQVDGLLEDGFKIQQPMHHDAKWATQIPDNRTEPLQDLYKSQVTLIAQAVCNSLYKAIKPYDIEKINTVKDLDFELTYDNNTHDYMLAIVDGNALISTYLKSPADQKTFRYAHEHVRSIFDEILGRGKNSMEQHQYRAKSLEDLVNGINTVLDEKHQIKSAPTPGLVN